jgi:hypothetical protein
VIEQVGTYLDPALVARLFEENLIQRERPGALLTICIVAGEKAQRSQLEGGMR